MYKNEALITFAGQRAKVVCDRNCKKAWGIQNRPRLQFSDEDEDDFVYLADHELGEAPENPGTIEGDSMKPLSPDDFPTKWCVRECERCDISNPGEYDKPIKVTDYTNRIYNYRKEVNQSGF